MWNTRDGFLGPKNPLSSFLKGDDCFSDTTSPAQSKWFESIALHCWWYSVWFTIKFIHSILLFGSLRWDFVCTLCFFPSIRHAPYISGSKTGKMVSLFRWIQGAFKTPVRPLLLPTFPIKTTNLVSICYLCIAPENIFPQPAGCE